MTCIVGLVHQGKVWIGGDSAGTAGYSLTVRADEKVFANGKFVMGFTTSFRMGQLLRHAFTPPDHDPRVDADKYMVTTFINAVRQCLKDGGFAAKDKDREEGGTFLVGYQGALYGIEGDYQVGRFSDPFAAVGCGAEIALGAMTVLDPEKQGAEACVTLALAAAERNCAGVRAPFKIVCG